jgi:hypothetical protein
MGNSFIQTSNLAQFNNLIQELMQGGPKRTVFQKWEVDLLLDFGTCRMRQSARGEIIFCVASTPFLLRRRSSPTNAPAAIASN